MPNAFPLFRKSANGRHLYRIEARNAFTEVQFIGNRVVIHRVSEAAYPEQVLIHDLIQALEGRYVTIGEAEFLKALDAHDGR